MRRIYQAPFCASISRSIGSSVRKHGRGVRQQSFIRGQRVQIGQRPPDVAGNDVEHSLGGRREKADVEIGVQEDRRDIGAVENVLQIVGGRALPLQGFLQLAVEGGQFLVERLQFLLRGQQLLVGRLIFLVDRQGLFVDRLLLLAGNFQIVDRALQFGSGRFQVPARVRRPGHVLRRRPCGPDRLVAPGRR